MRPLFSAGNVRSTATSKYQTSIPFRAHIPRPLELCLVGQAKGRTQVELGSVPRGGAPLPCSEEGVAAPTVGETQAWES